MFGKRLFLELTFLTDYERYLDCFPFDKLFEVSGSFEQFPGMRLPPV